MTNQTSSELNHDEVQRFAGRVFADLSSAFAGAMTLIGHRLGLYRALAEGGSQTSIELAQRTGTHERYVREWLHGQRAGGYVEYDPIAPGSRCRRSERRCWRSRPPRHS